VFHCFSLQFPSLLGVDVAFPYLTHASQLVLRFQVLFCVSGLGHIRVCSFFSAFVFPVPLSLLHAPLTNTKKTKLSSIAAPCRRCCHYSHCCHCVFFFFAASPTAPSFSPSLFVLYCTLRVIRRRESKMLSLVKSLF